MSWFGLCSLSTLPEALGWAMLGFAIPAQPNFLPAVSSPSILGLEASLRLFSEASHIPFVCCTTPFLCLPPPSQHPLCSPVASGRVSLLVLCQGPTGSHM